MTEDVLTLSINRAKEEAGGNGMRGTCACGQEGAWSVTRQEYICQDCQPKTQPWQRRKDRSLGELIALVERWAEDKGILSQGTTIAQADKTLSEAQEIKDAIEAQDMDGVLDGIGDTAVTLIIQARMHGISLHRCLSLAYDEIKDRTGQMVNGEFVKD